MSLLASLRMHIHVRSENSYSMQLAISLQSAKEKIVILIKFEEGCDYSW